MKTYVRSPLSLALIALIALVATLGPPGCDGLTVGDDTPDVEVIGDDDTTADDDDDTEPDPSDDDSAEVIGPATADPVFDPPGGGFVGSVTVTLTSSAGVGDILFCTASPRDVCELEPYVAPVILSASTILHARVDVTAEPGERHARSFVSLDAAVADDTSALPLMVFWNDGLPPNDSFNMPMGLDVFEPAPDHSALSDVPVTSGRCRLRVRGSSTGEFSKASYDLELWQPDSEDDRAEPLGGMPSDGDWVLYAPYYFDDALIRNSLGYELSRAIGRYAPRTRFVELYMANSGQSVGTADYLGVYVLTEEIERGAERVDVVELLPTDIAEPEVTGGYVFKRDREGEGESGIWAGDGGGYFSFDEPLIAVDPEEDELVSEQVQYLARFIAGFADALVAPDFIDPHSGQHYTEIIDVDSFIDHHILNVLVKNPDAFRLSGYLYKDCEQLVFAGPLWDLDRTAGANDPRAIEPTHWDASNLTSDTTYFFTYGWYGRLFDDPDFRDRYWARWTELLQGELDIDRILDTIDLLSEDLDEAAARNTARWGSAPLQQELNGLKGWFEARHQWISSCIDQYPDPRNCPG